MLRPKLAAVVFLAAVPLAGQDLLAPGGLPERQAAERLEEGARGKEPLGCSVEPFKPFLNFALRHQSGYRASLSARQFARSQAFRVLFRVRSESGRPYYFRQVLTVRSLPLQRGAELTVAGGYFIGEGVYSVDWLLEDNAGRVCEKQWKVTARRRGDERKLPSLIPDGTVAPLQFTSLQRHVSEKPYRVAILLHAAPMHPRSTTLTRYDQSLLLATLVGLLERSPFVETSVTAFSLLQQKEVFRTPRLTGSTLRQLRQAMDDLELNTVDFSVLQRKDGHLELLAELFNREVAASNPPDAIIFIGPNTPYPDRFPKELLDASEALPPVFYIHQDFYSRRFPFADSIERLTKTARGRVFSVYEPMQLVKAVVRIEQALASQDASGARLKHAPGVLSFRNQK
jgi:hypothetical protein